MVRALLCVLAVVSFSACRTMGELPPPPTDEQLRNDGSAAQVAALEQKYAVRAPGHGTWVVGNAVREKLVFMHRPDLLRYAETAPGAKATRWWVAAAGVAGALLVPLVVPGVADAFAVASRRSRSA